MFNNTFADRRSERTGMPPLSPRFWRPAAWQAHSLLLGSLRKTIEFSFRGLFCSATKFTMRLGVFVLLLSSVFQLFESSKAASVLAKFDSNSGETGRIVTNTASLLEPPLNAQPLFVVSFFGKQGAGKSTTGNALRWVLSIFGM
jgi:hypothetical protein